VTLRQSTQDFFVWLLGYEFSDTLVLFTKEKVVFAVSQKKKALLEVVRKPEG
jgi:nucleosome binding factor SPN SPT16 subunit